MNWLPTETTVAPVAEPATIGLVRDWLRLDTNDNDARLVGLIAAARTLIERRAGVRLYTQTVKMRRASFEDEMLLPAAPIQSITSVKYLDEDNVEQTLSGSVYTTTLWGLKPSIQLAYNQTWPTVYDAPDAVRVTAVAGYGDINSQPEDLRLALLRTVQHFFDGTGGKSLPEDVDMLLANSRLYWFA